MESGRTIPIPSEQTTITTDGATYTFAGSKLATGSPHTTTPTGTKLQSAASVTGSPAITPPPPGSPGAIPTTIPKSGSLQSQVAITFDDESYILPHTISVELLQTDGSFITLFSDSIISGTATVSVPQLSTPTTLSLGDLQIHAGPAPVGSPHTGGASGFTGLIDALESLAGNANAIVNVLDEISHQGVLWSAGSIGDSAFSSGVDSLLNTASSQLSGLTSNMISVEDSYQPGIYELSEVGQERYFEAFPGAVQEFDLLNSLRKLVRTLHTLRNDVLLNVKAYWKQGSVAAAGLAGGRQALREFGAYNWNLEKQRHTSTTTPTSTNSTMTSSSSSSETASPTAKPTLHWFETKKGTDVSTFESYIKTLPDKGEGVKAVFPGLGLQTYMTNLTLAQVKEVEKQNFIKFVYPVSSIDTASFGAIPPSHKIEKRINENLNLQKRLNSEDHLKIISQKKYAALDDYLFDPLLGRGQTIYIIDEGFNIHHEELARTSDRDVQNYVVPNMYTLANEPNRALWPPEDDISDINGHGTMVASIAGGLKYGVASKANLFLIKVKAGTRNPLNPSNPKLFPRATTDSALNHGWRTAQQDVWNKRNNGRTDQFIINMSLGKLD